MKLCTFIEKMGPSGDGRGQADNITFALFRQKLFNLALSMHGPIQSDFARVKLKENIWAILLLSPCRMQWKAVCTAVFLYCTSVRVHYCCVVDKFVFGKSIPASLHWGHKNKREIPLFQTYTLVFFFSLILSKRTRLVWELGIAAAFVMIVCFDLEPCVKSTSTITGW